MREPRRWIFMDRPLQSKISPDATVLTSGKACFVFGQAEQQP